MSSFLKLPKHYRNSRTWMTRPGRMVLDKPRNRLVIFLLQLFINLICVILVITACVKWRTWLPALCTGGSRLSITEAAPAPNPLWRTRDHIAPPTHRPFVEECPTAATLEVTISLLVVAAYIVHKLANKAVVFIKKTRRCQHFLLKFGVWRGSSPKTYIYLRLKHHSVTVILKLLTLPYDSKNIRALRIPNPVDLKLHRKWCKTSLNVIWDSNAIFKIDDHSRRIPLPSMIAIPLPLRGKTISICHRPCQVLLLFNNNIDSEFRPLTTDNNETLLADTTPSNPSEPTRIREEGPEQEGISLLAQKLPTGPKGAHSLQDNTAL